VSIEITTKTVKIWPRWWWHLRTGFWLWRLRRADRRWARRNPELAIIVAEIDREVERRVLFGDDS
jgi:UDP-N-acetyl-D-mannosaminuronic acid transferase (WecB/TagA/CpsF family)